jgi:hypothetical protein
VESKGTAINLEDAIPQTLAYMQAATDLMQPMYGMATNGGEVLFLKCDRASTDQPFIGQYDVSRIYSQLPLRNELYDVLQILKRLGQRVLDC